ncbi:uncharacterized protein LOC111127867 [Crassostrea virginica]
MHGMVGDDASVYKETQDNKHSKYFNIFPVLTSNIEMRSTLILFAVGTAIACVSAGGYGGGYGMNVGYGGIGGYGQSNYLGNTGYYQYMHQKPMYYALQPQVVTYGQGSGSGNLFGGGGSGGSGNLFGGGGYGNVYGGGVGGGSDLGAIIPIIIIFVLLAVFAPVLIGSLVSSNDVLFSDS